MKKAFAFTFLLALLFSFTACSQSTETFCLTAFTADISTAVGDIQYEGKLKYVSSTTMCVTLEKPESLKGLTVGTQQGNSFITLGTLSAVSPQIGITENEKNIFTNLFEALGSAGNTCFTLSNGKTQRLSGEYAFGSFCLEIDRESKSIKKIEAGKTAYTFANMTTAS